MARGMTRGTINKTKVIFQWIFAAVIVTLVLFGAWSAFVQVAIYLVSDGAQSEVKQWLAA